jgi:hypothetical protein
MKQADWSPKLWWTVPVAGFLVLMLVCLFIGNPVPNNLNRSSYDASPQGIRAAYLLLEELHYPVVRSKHPTAEAVKWVLFPTFAKKDVDVLGRWVRDGGALLLADTTTEFAEALGLNLTIDKDAGRDTVEDASGLDIGHLVGGAVRVDWPHHAGRVLVRAGGEPFVTVSRHGRGEIWLVNRPEFLQNHLIGKADNGVLTCRLAEAMMQERPGKLAFDEYFHGMRDRPGVIQLLFEPPTLWVTLEGLLVAGILLWHYLPRFGTLRPPPSARRRSKEEFLSAMASLLARKADDRDAYRTVRDDWLREIEQELGLPPQTPLEEVVREAARRRGMDPVRLRQALAAERVPAGSRPAVFVKALNDLETSRSEFFHGRHHR